LYEAFRQKEVAGHYVKRSLPETQYKQLAKEWSRGQTEGPK
jgi:hypothetical protein